jgi:hypothetical protein
MRVVDRVVKPQRELDLVRVARQVAQLVEPGKAFLEMLQGVVAAMRLAITRDQLFMQ